MAWCVQCMHSTCVAYVCMCMHICSVYECLRVIVAVSNLHLKHINGPTAIDTTLNIPFAVPIPPLNSTIYPALALLPIQSSCQCWHKKPTRALNCCSLVTDRWWYRPGIRCPLNAMAKECCRPSCVATPSNH